jgi:hypothetical protein
MMVIPCDQIPFYLANVQVSQSLSIVIQSVPDPVGTIFDLTERIKDIPNDSVNIWVDTGMKPAERGQTVDAT